MSAQTREPTAADKIARVYLFTGESDDRRKAAVDEIVRTVVDAGSEMFDLEVVDGEEASAADILAAVSTAPFASQRKVVVVERVERLSQQDQQRIAAFLPKLSSGSCLIMLVGEQSSPRARQKSRARAEQADESSGEQRKPARGLSADLEKAAKAQGRVETFARLKPAQLEKVAATEAEKHGKKIERAALALLSRSVEENAALLRREVEKLALYVGDRDTITIRDVENAACRSPEDQVFRLIDAIGRKRAGRAIRLLGDTFAASGRPENEVPRILALMARHFRLLYQLRFLKTAGVRRFDSVPSELQALLPKERGALSLSDWQRRRLLDQASLFSLDQVRDCLKRVLACELATKGLGADMGSGRLNLEMLVVRLCDRRQNVGRGG